VVAGKNGHSLASIPERRVRRLCVFGLFGARRIAVQLVRTKRTRQPLYPFGVFKAGLGGVLVVAIAFFTIGGIYGLMRFGAVEKGFGNLWGLVAIFWTVFGALVSAGLALLFYAWRGGGYWPPGTGGLGRVHKEVIRRYRSNANLFGPPPLFLGEDAAAYDDLHARFRAAVGPVDILEEMLVAEVVFSTWEVLRWHRLESSLARVDGVKALAEFLSEKIGYSLYAEEFATELASTLEANLRQDQAEQLADACARDEQEANDKVDQILDGSNLSIDRILDSAKQRKAEELARKYARREPETVKFVHKILASASVNIDDVLANSLIDTLDAIERISRLAYIAERRRTAILREIDRRRAILGEKVRRSVKEIEDAEFQVVEPTPAKRKTAA
jgi:hypothetical protein